ncbi:MAG: BREX system ATP-binding domain-containing protein [Blastocatellia bacterium]
MTGSIVNHPLFGRGQIMELRNAAREASVQFDNQIRAVVPCTMLSMLKAADGPAIVRPRRVIPKPAAPTPQQQERFAARRTIEALRYGVVPQPRIRELSAGLDRERASLTSAFDRVADAGGDVRVICGEYGAGKSHFFELAAQEALARNFLVATASLDVREVAPNRPQRIYNALVRHLRYPDHTDTGTLAPLFDRLVDNTVAWSPLMTELEGTIFSTALHNYSLMRATPGEALDKLLDWVSGEKVYIKEVRDAVAAKGKDFPMPSLSTMTTAADQYCYLLSGLGWLAQKAGYAGLMVLLDESEHYSLLNERGQERADNFFRGLMYSALSTQPGCRITEKQLTHPQRGAFPFRFADQSGLLVMFAVTPSASTFDYKRWLGADQIINLGTRMTPEALKELLSRLGRLHAQAHGQAKSVNSTRMAEALHECLEGRLINLRQLIRLAMEMFDLCYTDATFKPAQAANELRQVMLGKSEE